MIVPEPTTCKKCGKAPDIIVARASEDAMALTIVCPSGCRAIVLEDAFIFAGMEDAAIAEWNEKNG